MSQKVHIRVPATSANLGPGFDCLAMTLDLWNEVDLTVVSSGVQFSISGEGQAQIPRDETNLIWRSAAYIFEQAGQPLPGLRIECRNQIPLGSGLGSSAAAILAGMLGANALLSEPFTRRQVLDLAAEMEGHPDNVSAALLGGLVVVISQGGTFLSTQFSTPPLRVAVVLPEVYLPTKVARAVLPRQVPLADAVYNLGRVPLVVEALRTGNLDLLTQVMEDRLHQPFRLKLIAGAEQAVDCARKAGSAAVALSGAGPALIAFGDARLLVSALQEGFMQAGVASRGWVLAVSQAGASVERIS